MKVLKEPWNGYDILNLPGCPYRLPTARSMTQARMDYEKLLPDLYRWYEHTYLKIKKQEQPKP